MKLKLISLLLVLGFILPSNANAFFFSNMIDGMTSVANNIVDGATEVSVDMLELFEALADDIGEMSDRILDMADKIGEMADRIVATEQLMANMMVDIATIKNNTASSTTSENIIILKDSTQEILYTSDAPLFTISNQTSEYLVYVSSSMTMTTNTVSILVHNQEELESLWNNLESLSSDSKIYIAVKTIQDNKISSLSNVLTYNTMY